jgi:uncharacterized tellurite resistance protein B-like protein
MFSKLTCNVPSIHDFAKQVSQVLPRDPVVSLQVVVQHVHADDQVTRVERVRLVPALKNLQRLTGKSVWPDEFVKKSPKM